MSETAQTLIKAALRSIGAIGTGRTPSAAELQDGLEAMQIMFRSWSARNIRLYYSVTDTVTMDGSESYTIGSGGDVNTTRPSKITGARLSDSIITLIGEKRYRELAAGGSGGETAYLWYNPDYPLGLLYFWPRNNGTAYIDSLKPLSDPALITSDVEFPPEYDEAIKYSLAVRMAPEYEKEASQTVKDLAISSLKTLEMKNFAAQIEPVRLGIPSRSVGRYDIDADN